VRDALVGYLAGMQVMSRCPVCGERVYVAAGDPTPEHKAEDGGEKCPGSGQPSQ
jgi:hypothetical protein